ncbi:MAG: class I SAM-dependent methyltransferase [Alphaproteobacteria bacterium]|nr:class I SAM-dependent methyltransferase [Alphaproteobacteria bacterium]
MSVLSFFESLLSNPASGKSAAGTQSSSRPIPRKNAGENLHGGFLWHANRDQVLEAIWGGGHVLPGGNKAIDRLIAPINLQEDKDLLDLSAGMGAVGRRLANRFGAYVTGLEPDEELAKYGMEFSGKEDKATQASVAAYDPERFIASKQYCCIIARGLFYRVANKKRFFREVARSLKPKNPRGQMVFTDYVLENSDRNNPAVVSWMAAEAGADPLSMEGLVGFFSKNGIDIRVREDLTSTHMMEIIRGFDQFTEFLNKYPPDAETKVIISQETDLWASRVSAMRNGLKHYRFYAIKY